MSEKEMSPEEKLMTTIFGKPISEMSEEEKQAILDEEYDNEAESVSDEEFEKIWGISIDDHTKKMMCFVHWANAVNHFLIENKCVKDSYNLHDLTRIAKFFYELGKYDIDGHKLEYIKHPADFKSEDDVEVPENEKAQLAELAFYDLVTSKWKEGKVVWMSEEGPLVMDFDKWVKQPLAGMLYDLNRDLAVVLTFINDPKWVNDYATVRLLEYFYNKYQDSRTEIEVLEKQIENLK